jgi:Domain of unknown function (DUF1788)
MNAIDRLLSNYARQVRLPWATNLAGIQRVWFAIYPPAEERRLRAKQPQFEATTLEAHHGWLNVDLTEVLPQWIAAHEYREAIFAEPEHFTVSSELEDLAVERVRQACQSGDANVTCVVAVTGLATLFDFMRVSSLVERVEDSVSGRLLVFFPGEYAGNVYRFMDARDGFNYMAVPITATESFIPP